MNNTFDNNRSNDSRKRDFKREDRGKRQFGGRDRERERSQMHEAICSDCGKRCEVPFRPTGDKPIYCNQCFSRHRGSPVSISPESRSYEKHRFQDRRMFDATCAKCGKRFELPFRPTGEKPVYCNDCFGRTDSKSNGKIVDQYKEQFNILNAKLDRIIRALTPVIPAREEKKEVIVEEKKEATKKKEAVDKKPVLGKKEKVKKFKKPADKKQKAKPKTKPKKDKKEII